MWTTFTLYSNVVAEKVHLRAMFVGMAGIATMAAAVPLRLLAVLLPVVAAVFAPWLPAAVVVAGLAVAAGMQLLTLAIRSHA